MSGARKNAHRKYLGLLRRRARYFLAAGPGGQGRLFETAYGPNDFVDLREAPMEALRYGAQAV